MAEDGAMSWSGSVAVLQPRGAGDCGANVFHPRPLHEVHARRDGLKAFRLNRVKPVGGAAKRVVDVAGALVLLTLLAPLMLIVAGLVKLTSKGPALFKQDRSGFRGRPFKIYKFRTMTVQENSAVVVGAARNDQRVTAVGAFLRKSSIDELPQILNVLRGEMSFIGPRPHALAHDRQFTRINSSYPKRFAARPGISGLAQVSGSRGTIGSDEELNERVRHDLAYIGNWSLWLDVQVVVKTVLHVLSARDAY